MERLYNYCFEKRNVRILDVGCGEGEFIEDLFKIFEDYDSIYAIDVDKDIVNRINDKYSSRNVKALEANIENLPFESEYFDIVSISRTLHHLPNAGLSLLEAKRVMKKDGYLIINEMIYDNQSLRQEVFMEIHHFKGDVDMILGNYHHNTLSKEEIKNSIDENGLTIEFSFEFLDDTGIPCTPEKIEEKKNEILINLNRVKGHSKYNEFKVRGNKTIDKLYERGIWGPRHLVAVCKKVI